MCPRVKPRQKNNPDRPAKLWVLLVGVNQYQDRQNLASLQYSALDCQGLGEALKEATASFLDKEVVIHHDFARRLPSLNEVRQSITQITTAAGSEDTILFYFSGHGVLDSPTQQVVLCLSDTDTTRLSATGLPLKDLLRQLSCAASQQLVWLDACHSGAMTLRGTDIADPSSRLVEVLRNKAAQSKGFYALLSCDRAQQSWEFPELGHGVFTYYLMRGLRGEAADARGEIEADALYQYVFHQTLRYIDKTNQQIRLINQQKSSRGEGKLQSEFPMQTPKRIVEGFGKVVLGKRSRSNLKVNPRQALVIDGSTANRTTLALSQILQSRGDFNLRYFPQTNEPWSEVKNAIQRSVGSSNETSGSEIATALLYIRARIETTDTGESWLVLPDGIRLSPSWLRKVLKNSRAVQQIVILDCLGEHSPADWVEDLQLETARGQCTIAANSPTDKDRFAEALLSTLQNRDPKVELPVAAWISRLQMTLAGTEVTPQVWLSGTQGVIEILVARNEVGKQRSTFDLGICPYMGLEAFNEASAEYFYGREALVQKMLNHINHQSSLAVVGASGSGKSSVVQAGLIARLRQGKQIPGSDRWWLGCFRPGKQPIRALAKLLSDPSSSDRGKEQLQIEGLLYQGVEGFVRWLRSRSEPMVVLVIDQFEELFTLAAQSDRQQLIELVLGAVQYAGDRFKLVLTIRADFTVSCLKIPDLARLLQQNSILVPPYLTEENYRSSIVKPARQVGLKVESGLVEVLLQDLDRSAGDLPLLQFALQQLWSRRENGKLTLNAYQDLGKIQGALEKQAQKVYDSLDPQTQDCARWIFLNLTQLGEGTEDTRRRLTKSDLIVAKYPEALIDKTLRILTEAKLLVVNLDSGNNTGQSRSAAETPEDDELFLEAMRQEATVEVVHEILIRHWSTLRWWLEENRARLRSQRQIEQAALLWQQNHRQDDFILHGVRLAEAEEVYIKYTDELSDTAKEFVAACIDARVARQRAMKKRLRQTQLTAAALGILGLTATAFGITAYRQQLITQIENINSLTAVAEAQLLSNRQLESVATSVKAGQQLKQINGLGKAFIGADNWQETQVKTAAGLQQSIYGTQELNRLEGHPRQVEAVSVSDDGKMFATASSDATVKIWHQDGRVIKKIAKDRAKVNPIVVNVNGTQKQIANPIYAQQDNSTEDSVYLVADEMVQLRSPLNNKSISYPHSQPVNSFSTSPDGTLLATATRDGIHIWSSDGILRQTLNGHTGEVLDVEFIPSRAAKDNSSKSDRYRLVSTGVDKTVRVWQIFDRYSDEAEAIYSVAVSPVDDTYAAANWSGKIDLWRNHNGTQQLIRTLPGHQNTISQIKYSPDGKSIASAGWNKTIELWDMENGKLIATLTGHTDGVNSIAFSPDGQTLVSGSEDKTLKIWNLANQPKLVKTLTGHTDGIKAVAISFDGQSIASAGYDNTIKLWSIAGELLQTFDAHDLAITSLAFTRDSNLASASWDNTIKLWNLSDEGKSSKLLHTLKHQDGVTAIDLNSDGTVLASASGDRQIKLWDTATGNSLANLRGHTSQINSLAFSNDNRFIVSGEEQQGLFWWNLDLDNLIAKGCDRLSNYLAIDPKFSTDKHDLCL